MKIYRIACTSFAVLAITAAAAVWTVDSSYAQGRRGLRINGPDRTEDAGPGFGHGMHGVRGEDGPGRPEGPEGPRGHGIGHEGPGGPGGFIGFGVLGDIRALRDELGVTDEQVDQIKAILDEHRESENREAVKTAVDNLREEVTSDAPSDAIIDELSAQLGTAVSAAAKEVAATIQQVKAVLTEEQLQTLEEWKAEREAKREEQRQSMIERLKDRLEKLMGQDDAQ